MNHIDKLAMMANQIAMFFKSYPHDEAVAGTATHIEAFWTPKMRADLREASEGLSGLDPIVLEIFSPVQEACDPTTRANLSPGNREGGDDAG